MRAHKPPFVMLLLVVCGLLSPGCIDATRTGLTDGLSRGVRNTVSGIVEDFLQAVIDGE
ncbi:MAG: hypothetical protein IH897_13710 [Planctomycetes bacterium]|nr:hypothetical protein [Planctomycetota bacterium]